MTTTIANKTILKQVFKKFIPPQRYHTSSTLSTNMSATTTTTAPTTNSTNQKVNNTEESNNVLEIKHPVPPFTHETATLKVRMAEDAWNSRDPDRVKMAYTPDTVWRNRSQFVTGRDEVKTFLEHKWSKEDEYRLIKELFAFTDNKIAVRFCYEYIDETTGQWYRAYGNENWEFNDNGLMAKRHASINDVPIADSDRKFHWDRTQPRPVDYPGLSDLGL